jgi:hypothetical protein
LPNVKLCWKVPAFAAVLAITAAALSIKYLFMIVFPRGVGETGTIPFSRAASYVKGPSETMAIWGPW